MTADEISSELLARAKLLHFSSADIAARIAEPEESVVPVMHGRPDARLGDVLKVADALALVVLVVPRPLARAVRPGFEVTEPRVPSRVEQALATLRPPRTVLFLDLDGTTHAVGDSRIDPQGALAGEQMFRWWPQLESILEKHPEVDVVIHSSWRLFWPTVDSLLPLLPAELAARVSDLTDPNVPSRFESIQIYLQRHPEVGGHVILDDSADAFPLGLAELVLCQSDTGLSDPKVRARLARALSAAVKLTRRVKRPNFR